MILDSVVKATAVNGLWELPEGWAWVRFGSILKLEYGKSLPARIRDSSGQYPVFGSGGQVGVHYSAFTKTPTIVIGRKGSIGALFFSTTSCWPIDTTYYIDEFPPYIDPKYIYFFLQTLGLEKLNKAAAIPGLNRDDVHGLTVPLPFVNNYSQSLDTQRRIVTRIETLLAEVKRARTLLEYIRRDTDIVLKAALGEVIKKLDRRSPESPTLHALISDGRLTITGGGTPSTGNKHYWNGAIPWVSPKDMKSWYIDDTQDHISPVALEETAVKLVPKKSVLVVVRGMILAHTFPVGVTTKEVTINQDMKALSPADDLLPEYLAYILRARASSILREVEIAAHGTRRLKTDTLMQIVVPDIPKDSQQRTVTYLDSVQSAVNDMQRILDQDAKLLDQLEQSILERAFRGEL